MCLYQPLPRFIASNRGDDGHAASRRKAEFRRTQPVRTLTGVVWRGKSSHKLTAAHSGSSGLEVTGTDSLEVYYLPRVFEELSELSGLEGEP